MAEQKPGNIVIFKNKFKKPDDNAPDIKGFCTTPDGVRLEVALWRGDGGNYTGKIKPPRNESSGSQRRDSTAPEDDDSIPF